MWRLVWGWELLPSPLALVGGWTTCMPESEEENIRKEWQNCWQDKWTEMTIGIQRVQSNSHMEQLQPENNLFAH